MEAKDLRIGNLIETNIVQQVTIEHLEFLLNTELDHSVMKPIPLTEEWLVKFGFKKVSDIEINNDEIGWRKEDKDTQVTLNSNLSTIVESNDYYGVCSIPLTHVHSLQNLYYALTNTELTINL